MAFWYFCVVKCKLEPAILCASLGCYWSSCITCAVFCACTFSPNCAETKTTISFTHFALFDLDAHRYLIKHVPIAIKAGKVLTSIVFVTIALSVFGLFI